MTADPSRLVVVASVPHEAEAAVIANALMEHGIRAMATGGYTSGFRAEAPGDVKVLITARDLPAARALLAEIHQEQEETEWPTTEWLDEDSSPD